MRASVGCPRQARIEIGLRQSTRDSQPEYQCRQAEKGDDADHIGNRNPVQNFGCLYRVTGLQGDRYFLAQVFDFGFYQVPVPLNPDL
jgi:hypothetical protein